MSAFLDNFHFLRPWWLLVLALLPVLIWRWRHVSQQQDPWRKVCDPHLLPHLQQPPADALRRGARGGIMALLLILMALAMAGPAWQKEPQQSVRLQSSLLIAVDLSDRMRAADLKPDRMTRVRFKLTDLLSRRHEGQTALIGYAGEAFTVAPLTDDAASLLDLAASLSPDVMPIPGQRVDRAVNLALELLHNAGQVQGDLLIVTDSAESVNLALIRQAQTAGLRTSVLGVGTEQGAPIPLARGGFLQDRAGTILIPKRDDAALAAMARAGGGRYVPMQVGEGDLQQLGVMTGSRDGKTQQENSDLAGQRWRDEGVWLMCLILPLAALLFRRGTAVWGVMLLLSPLFTSPAQAAGWKDLWQRADQQAWQALQQGEAETAREKARDSDIRASAAYRLEQFDEAIDGFSQKDTATAHYNRGNALAKAGRYPEALDAYDEALRLQPDFPDASANKAAIEEWLKQQPPSQQNQGNGDSQQDQQNDASQQDSSSSDENSSDSSSQDQKNSDGQEDEEQNGDENESDASRQDDSDEKGDSSQQDDTPLDPQDTDNGEDQDAAQPFEQQLQEALDQQEQGEEAPLESSDLTPEEAERQQAMEHLLQRVPDDPGGLLRRKFQLEHQRRQQEGDRR